VCFITGTGAVPQKWRDDMKKFCFLKRALLALVLLPFANALAANKGSLHVASPEDVVGQTLGVGDYTVRWEGGGPDVELKIMRGKRIVATAPAHKMQLTIPAANDTVEVDTRGGARNLKLIYFAGNPTAFVIQDPPPAVQVSSR
jgi:hypothetical protein